MSLATEISVLRARRRAVILPAWLLCLTACQVLPPPHGAVARAGLVRAATSAEAERVAHILDRLAPEVVELLPDSRQRTLEVWVQESPALYRFAKSAYEDADGFWAADAHRIHLRERADNLERTLAHELVHASLGKTWRTLPGTLEEGLCDAISAELCPGGAARMRAGRLSSAGFATGGLVLELDLCLPGELHPLGLQLSFHARIRLEGDPPDHVDPLDVFRVEAGLSSASLPGDRKKAFYGLSYLVVERILARHGIAGFHELCAAAHASGLEKVPRARLLAAAGLDDDPETWRRALNEALGPAELAELVRMHPRFLIDTIVDFFRPYVGAGAPGDVDAQLLAIEAKLSLPGGRSQISLLGLPEIRQGLAQALRGSDPATLAQR